MPQPSPYTVVTGNPAFAPVAVPQGIQQPNTIPPVVEGPGIRNMPPDGRQSYIVITGAVPIRVAPLRTWRQGVLVLNEDAANAVRLGERDTVTATTGALLPAGASVILRASAELWAVAVAGTPQLTVIDEWYSAPPQRQPMGA